MGGYRNGFTWSSFRFYLELLSDWEGTAVSYSTLHKIEKIKIFRIKEWGGGVGYGGVQTSQLISVVTLVCFLFFPLGHSFGS